MSSARALAGIIGLGAAIALCFVANGYQVFVIANVALTAIVGVGLNVLLGLTGQVSLGQVGFYAIGAYAVAICTTALGLAFWLSFALGIVVAGAVGLALAVPALRVTGPYLAMVTIAFGFIVEHGTVEWRALTGGANGILNIPSPALFGYGLRERDIAILSILFAALSLMLFRHLSISPWGRAMRAVRDAETAAQSLGLNPVTVRTIAFGLAAVAAGAAGGLFAPLSSFISPSSFSFFQSILFLLVVMVGGAGSTTGPLVGAVVVVLLPEALAGLSEYRPLMYGVLLFFVLLLAPRGLVGLAEGLGRRRSARAPANSNTPSSLDRRHGSQALVIDGLSKSFGGVRAVADVGFEVTPGRIISLIGPNGAGKTTVLNLICGFYRPDRGSARLDTLELAGRASHAVARAGIARTYQTSQLFGQMSVVENILVGLRGSRLGSFAAALIWPADETALRRSAENLLAFVGYGGPLEVPAASLPHVDRRLVEIARALAIHPSVLMLDEPAAGLTQADKARLGDLLRRIADAGIAVLLVEHDMDLVMALSHHVVVLDAGRCIAAGPPAAVQAHPAVRKAYLGERETGGRGRRAPYQVSQSVLEVRNLSVFYGQIPALHGVSLSVGRGEMVGVLGANGAGKSTLMRALSGLLRPEAGEIALLSSSIAGTPAHRIVRAGLILVPEGRLVFPELSVRDNLELGAFTRREADVQGDVERLLDRFPALRRRADSRAGLLSGGEQQMLAIARGLVARPTILLLDEPSLGLAPTLVAQLFDELAALRDEGTTILLVDQMAAMTLSVADRAYILESGRILQAGSADSLRGDPGLERAYLGKAASAQERREG